MKASAEVMISERIFISVTAESSYCIDLRSVSLLTASTVASSFGVHIFRSLIRVYRVTHSPSSALLIFFSASPIVRSLSLVESLSPSPDLMVELIKSVRKISSSLSGYRTFISITKPVLNLSLMCSADPKHLNMPPAAMMPIFVDSASASSMEWVVKMMALVLCSWILATTLHMKRRDSGSIPAEGSSRRIILGFPRIAIATDSLRLLPPLNYSAIVSLYSWRSSSSMAASTIWDRMLAGMPLMVA